MKLREFTDEDIFEYALTHGGRNVRNVFSEIKAEYEAVISSPDLKITHRVIVNDMKNKISSLIDQIIDLHSHCLKSEDDEETRSVAEDLKSMHESLEKLFDSL
jgi:hypothetical protein